MSRLGLGLGLTKGGVIPFNPLSLDPYLFFDSRSSMIGTLENPTLDLDPANPETLDVITATRSGVATYTDEDGLIQTASPDTVRVDYTQGEELTPTKFQRVGYTDFSSGWTNGSAVAVAGDGYSGQESLAVTAASAYVSKYINVPTTSGVSYFGGFYIRRLAGTGEVRVFHQLSATGNRTVITVTDEWQFVGVEFLGESSGSSVRFGVEIVVAGDSVEIAMPQVEEGTTVSDFVANTTGSPKYFAAATYGPRVPMILVEPAATNGFTHSEGINNYSSLGRANCTYSLDSTPFGGFNSSCKITSNTFTNSLITSVVLFNSVSGESNYFTFRVKKKNGWFLKLFAGNGCASSHVDVGLSGEGYISSSGTTASSYLVEEFDDYYLVGIETLQNGTTTGGLILLRFFNNSSFANYNLDTIEEFFVTGIQWENNSTVSTSYIPTSGSAVTRAADDLVIDGSDFTDFYNQSEGTFYFEGVPQNLTDAPIYWMDTSPASQRIAVYDSFNVNAKLFIAGTSSEQSASYYLPNQLARLAISVKSNAQELSVNGGTSVTLTESSLPSPTSLHIGSRFSGSDYFNGHIKRLIYWPYHSDNL
jgi:hypothetical protein